MLMRYPSYWDSGVEWLGEIPEHWEVRRLKTIAGVRLSNVDKKTVPGQVPVMLCNYVDVYYNDRIGDDIDFMLATATEDQMERFSLRRGDVLITKDSEDPTDIAVAAVVAKDLPGVVCGYHLAQIRPNPNAPCDGRYLARAFVAAGVGDQFAIAANGITRFDLTGRAIGDGVFVLPPLADQRVIADFLDRETERIDRLIEKKERLVGLLRERRTALIRRAVTRGLDPDAPMKETGVKWLGEIPAHWEVKRLKCVATINDEVLPETTGDTMPIRYVDIGNVDSVRGIVGVDNTNFGQAPSRARRIVREGDVIISTVRTYLKAVTRIELRNANIVVSTGFAVIRPGSALHDGFTGFALQASSFVDQVVANSMGVSYPAITPSDLSCLAVAVPPRAEQIGIADHLDRETRNLDTLLQLMGQGMCSLAEYRSALISTAVRGGIDMRRASVPKQGRAPSCQLD